VKLPALSVLDLAVVPAGSTSAGALADTTRLAQVADGLGYLRFWVAEHHNIETVASTSPAVLIAHIAERTSRIRVGSGGVMLPNHSPLAIAEQFALLEALHPGRIDLGIGRAPGSDPRTASILRRSHLESVEEFPRDVLDVMGLLGAIRTEHGLWEQVSATPRAEGTPMIALLGSSDYSARLAGLLGIPFAYAHHFDTGATHVAAGIYLDSFQPSPALDVPYLIVTVSALAADTPDEAARLSAPGLLRRYGIRTGRRGPLLGPDDALAHPEMGAALAMPTTHISGTTDTVVSAMHRLAADLRADELMIATTTHGLAERQDNLTRIATAWASRFTTAAEAT
jgi:luciferase family oxidoreductase group 1